MLNKIFTKKKNENTGNILTEYFYELENSNASCFQMAISSFNAIKDQCSTEEELLSFLLEDSLFTSLYATFYEHLLVGIYNNQSLALPLIAKFKEQTESREQILAAQSQDHLVFIENNGHCPGCSSCENHQDVLELVGPYANGDLSFFIELYLGMLTIQFAMESLIYDLIPGNTNVTKILDAQNILKWRQTIYEYAQLQIKESI